jgi:hypothetical protein
VLLLNSAALLTKQFEIGYRIYHLSSFIQSEFEGSLLN